MWHKNWSQNLKEVAGRIVRDGFGQLVFIFCIEKAHLLDFSYRYLEIFLYGYFRSLLLLLLIL